MERWDGAPGRKATALAEGAFRVLLSRTGAESAPGNRDNRDATRRRITPPMQLRHTMSEPGLVWKQLRDHGPGS